MHSIPSIDNDDVSAVAIALPNGRNGYVHLNQAPPNRHLLPNGDVAPLEPILVNGIGAAETPLRRVITNGSAVCLPDTISPATSGDEEKKQPPRGPLTKQASSTESDSMHLEIHKVDTDLSSDLDPNPASEPPPPPPPPLPESDASNSESEAPSLSDPDSDSEHIKELATRKLSAIAERDDSSSLSVRSDDSVGERSPTPSSEQQDKSPTITAEDAESMTTLSTTSSSETPGCNRLGDVTHNGDDTAFDNEASPQTDQGQEDNARANDQLVNDRERAKPDDATGLPERRDGENELIEDNLTSKTKNGKEQLNEPLDEADVEISVDDKDKLIAAEHSITGIDNYGFAMEDGENMPLSHSIQVKSSHLQPNRDKVEKPSEEKETKFPETEKDAEGKENVKDTASEGNGSAGHSRNSSHGGGGISGPRRSILRRDRSKRQSAKSVKFDIPDSHDDKPKEKRLYRKPTGKVPRNQQLKKKGSKGSAKGNASASKRRRTLVKQQAQSAEEPPSAPTTPTPVSNGVISAVAPHAARPPLLSTSSSSSFGYMGAVQSSQAERLQYRICAQQRNINVLFVGFLLYAILSAPRFVLALVRTLCATCTVTAHLVWALHWLMCAASLLVPLVLLCFLPEYKSAIKSSPPKQ